MIAPTLTTAGAVDFDALNAMRGAGGVEPIWLPNPWLAAGGRVLMLGCGAKPMVGAVNHDRHKHSSWVDVAFDLDAMPWPSTTGGPFDAVYTYDVVEHMVDVLGFVNQIHGVLKSGGILVMRGGAANNPAVWTDPTHLHFFNPDSMDFFDRSTGLGNHYGRFYTDRMGRPLTEWRIDGVDLVNAHPDWPDTPDIQWTMVAL